MGAQSEDSPIERYREELGLPPSELDALRNLNRTTPASVDRVASGGDLDALMCRLGMSAADQDQMRATTPFARPELAWLFGACLGSIIGSMGRIGPIPRWPSLPQETGLNGCFLYPWVFLTAVEHTRAYHRSIGVPDDISWASLAALGTQMSVHRALNGSGGLHTQDWLTHHFRGLVYAVDRLHFERTVVRFSSSDPDAPPPGTPALSIHIPAGSPLSPEACDEALQRAVRVFGTAYPQEPCSVALCESWLLDPQLRGVLQPESNIIRFQDRFRLVGPGRRANDDVVASIFLRPLSQLDSLPVETTLQRAVVDVIRSGGSWRSVDGWFRMPPSRCL